LVGDLCRLQCLQDKLILIDPDLGAPLSLNVFDLDTANALREIYARSVIGP